MTSPDAVHEQALQHFQRDPVLAAIVAAEGPLAPLPVSPDPFATLVRSVIGQQLSVRAANTIEARVRALAPDLSAEQLAALSAETLRAAGLSGAKVRTVHALVARVLDGTLDFERLVTLPDEDVIAALVPLPGIGRWTAEMFLMFALGRPDVFAWGDLGLRRALERHYPDLDPVLVVAAWSPYRSAAARYMWLSLRNTPQ
ncbi:DNA-3-methyladenine glycosylase family protein [Deinococcus maricopensis]|uniref:DNA-3-methyladenine glycosylase II n=1 Tax=Deinococcus maricopensis (strain DSM 21211 / LMG 22137 / NRRL B-23946 / LB-34) TaxID=709986 RepID=E8U3K9_DEIML|nr:DNA-3-methyladenine glycosylase [Deinococcus maricopensis]ADV68633.1 HhH-GPD family protein [Deinococcus maricopensis DSM 21211]